MYIRIITILIFSYCHNYCHSLYKTIEIKAPYIQTLIMQLPTKTRPKLILGNFSLENQLPTEISEYSINPNQIIKWLFIGLDTTVSQGTTILVLEEMHQAIAANPDIKENKINS